MLLAVGWCSLWCGGSASFGKSSFVSVLDDKANPAYWYHYYDERYCGPSRGAYMEEMAKRYREAAQKEP